MSVLLEALDREIEFFKAIKEESTDQRDIDHSYTAAAIYLSLKLCLSLCRNDITRMNTIASIRDGLPADAGVTKELLDEFIAVNEAHYVLNFEQATQVAKTLKGYDEDQLANKLFSMSMTCDPEYLKEILAKQA